MTRRKPRRVYVDMERPDLKNDADGKATAENVVRARVEVGTLKSRWSKRTIPLHPALATWLDWWRRRDGRRASIATRSRATTLFADEKGATNVLASLPTSCATPRRAAGLPAKF